uniref:Uncharacterized protein n=1 Tax=Tetraodon nigroviridis TaxID=99883 RepID=H3BZI4_TETNG
MFLLLCFSFILQGNVLQRLDPGSQKGVHVERWLLTWSPAPPQTDVTFTVESKRFGNDTWTNVPACVQISSSQCNVSRAGGADEHGCMMLRVRADRRGLRSEPVEACSRLGDLCTPSFQLSARSGALTVHLTRNHSLAAAHAYHLKHRVFYGREGRPLTDYTDKVSSVSVQELQAGQRYCVQTQFLVHGSPVGPRSCVQCQLIPESSLRSTPPWVVATAVLLGVPALLAPVLLYLAMYRCGRFKWWLRSTRHRIPAHFYQDLSPEGPLGVLASAPEEHYDPVSVCRPPGPLGPGPADSATLSPPGPQQGPFLLEEH